MMKLLKFDVSNTKLYHPFSICPRKLPSISLFTRKLSLFQTHQSKNLTLNSNDDARNNTQYSAITNSGNIVTVQEIEQTSISDEDGIKGKVILIKKSTSRLKDKFKNPFFFFDDSLVGKKVSFQLVDASNDDNGKVGKRSFLEEQIKNYPGLGHGEYAYKVSFDKNEEIAFPGALIVRNEYHKEIYLRTITLENVPKHGTIHFLCNSWVYPTNYYKKDRVFFSNKTYLPHETPKSLAKYREEELETLRGKGKENQMLEEWDRVYDYAYYNDLGEPQKGPDYVRPILGGSEFPYPRRGRTSRPPNKKDPEIESRLSLLKGTKVYIPRDEKFGHVKLSDFFGDTVKSLYQGIFGMLDAVFDSTPKRFDSFKEVMEMYEGAITLQDSPALNKLRKKVPTKFLQALFRSDGAAFMNYPKPDIVKVNESAWKMDEEFARQMLAGIHPLIIRRLEEFPPVSKLDPKVYGNQNSTITKECIEGNLDGLKVEEAIELNRLFILDHHDTIMPLLRKVEEKTTSRVYASRALLFLQADGTLKPLVIELSLPHPDGDQFGAISEVYTPSIDDKVKASLWWLAKTYVTINDSAYHQLISHWLHTHAVIEPFVIATHRRLSELHPIHKLLHPHFRDTMPVNTIARQIALNAKGLFEQAVFTRQYVGEWTSRIYQDWVFTEQALPKDLMNRGMAVEDSNSPNGYKLLIEDYPYAVDGLEIWSAIKTWVTKYCSYYYKSNDMVVNDTELQFWWREIQDVGHGDAKGDKWPEMKTVDVLIETCTTIIWVASALHAVLNFGQYPYGGYMPNRPTISRRYMPKEDEHHRLKDNADCVFLETVTSQLRTAVCISVIELISRHSEDEVYLGQREPGWTSDELPLEALEKFNEELDKIEVRILERNENPELKNRVGPAKLPFTLLCRSSDVGITGRGIPNSVSL